MAEIIGPLNQRVIERLSDEQISGLSVGKNAEEVAKKPKGQMTH